MNEDMNNSTVSPASYRYDCFAEGYCMGRVVSINTHMQAVDLKLAERLFSEMLQALDIVNLSVFSIYKDNG